MIAALVSWALTAAAPGAAPPAPSHLAPRRIAVIPSVVQGSQKSELSPSVEVLFETIARRSELRLSTEVVSYNELFVDGAEPIASSVVGCGSDLSCMARVPRRAQVDLIIRGIVNFALEPPLITLSVIDARSERRVAESIGEVGHEAGLQAALRAAADAVLDQSGFVRAGRLEVELEPGDLHLFVGRCRTPACDEVEAVTCDARRTTHFTVPGGRYRLEGSKDGFVAHRVEADVVEGQAVRVALALGLAPKPDDAPGLLASPWFWALVGGLVTVAGGTVAVLVTEPRGAGRMGCVCVATSASTCPPCP